MTDKQIIIDGVDVSGCAYITYRDSENPICSETGQYCKGYDICYYKQLKRKEQECEELKEKYKWYDHYKEQALYNKNLCNEKSKQLDQLKAENEKLKKINKPNDETWKTMKEKKKIKRSECPYGGIDCAWCGEDCE